MSRFRSITTALPLVLALSALPATVAVAQQQEMPPTPVSVVEMVPQPLPVVNELPGRVSATRTAEVRPRVAGIVLERVFEQGSLVKQGDVLYRIDPAQYAVAKASAQATLERAKANQLNARDQQTRAEALRERRVTSGVDLENAITNLAIADAEVAIAQAALDQAQLNLNYTEVTAPISGVIGRALVTEGALVGAQTDVMATVQQLDPIYADFTQSTSDVLALRRAMQAGQLVASAPGEAQVRLIYDDGTVYEHPGKLLFSEATVDPLTGQVTMRGEFPNPDDDLLPGLYVRISIEQAVRNDALAVPQMAVQRDQQGNSFVYIINAENQAERRTVKLGRTLGPRWMVMEGLQAGDKVVAEGAQKLFPGAPVAPEPWNDANAAAAAPAEAAAGDAADATADQSAVDAAADAAAQPAAPAAEQPTPEQPAPDQPAGDQPAQNPTE